MRLRILDNGKSGQLVSYIQPGKLRVLRSSEEIAIGVLARDVRANEMLEYSHQGNTNDIIITKKSLFFQG